MKTKITPHVVLAAVLLFVPSAFASTLTWDTSAGAGIQAGSGTWDLNNLTNWTEDGGATRIPWTSSDDLAQFLVDGSAATITVNDGNGQVGALGLRFEGAPPSFGNWTVSGDMLQVGAGGIVNRIPSSSVSVLFINSAIQLTDSQTWSSVAAFNNNNTTLVRVGGNISSASNPTNLTFDGRGLTNAVSQGNTQPRVGFALEGANSYTGSTTVVGGALLRLAYNLNGGNKLDDSSALIFAGGTVSPNGGSNVVEVVGSTVVAAANNSIYVGPNGGGGSTNRIQLGNITQHVGGTLEFTNAVSGAASTTTLNTNGIIGGWATVGPGWAVGSADGTDTIVSGTSGSSRSTFASWGTGETVNSTAAVTFTSDKTLNALRLSAPGGSTYNQNGFNLTLTSGGLMNISNGSTISGGTIRSGHSSGQLFIYSYSTNSLIISSTIEDNGGTPTVLVKGGASSLTLTGTNTYTGGTYVNAGTLAIGSGGSIVGPVTVHGGATFDVTAQGFNVGAGRFLAGGGTVLGNVTVGGGGILNPGTAFTDDQAIAQDVTGTLSFGNDLTLQDGSILQLGLGWNSDLILLTNGLATLTGSSSIGGISLQLYDAGGTELNETYTLLSWEAGTTLADFDLSDFTVSGLQGNLLFGTNSLEFNVTAIPEPGTMALLSGAMLLVLARKRRR